MSIRMMRWTWFIFFVCGFSYVSTACGPGESNEQVQEQSKETVQQEKADNDAGDVKEETPKEEAPKEEPPKEDLPKESTPQAAFTIQLLHAADHEGGVDAVNDAPRMSAVINGLKGTYPNTLILASGDLWLPGPFYTASADSSMSDTLKVTGKGRADIMMLNAMGFQVSVFGNHEFDEGPGTIADIIKKEDDNGKLYPGANFPILSSNLDFSKDGDLKDLVTTDGQEAKDIPGKIAKSVVITVNGEKFGVVGCTTPTLASISSPGSDISISPKDHTDMDALAAIVQTSVDALTKTGINKIIVLCHMQQIKYEKELAEKLKDVDIIIAGGSDSILADDTDRLRPGHTKADTYPIWKKDANGEHIAIVNTDGQYQYVGRLVVGFDKDGKLIKETVDPKISGAYACDDQGVKDTGDAKPSAEVQKIADAVKQVIVKKDGDFFGITKVYLNGMRGSVRREETNLGNLTADANLFIAQQHDATVKVSIKNGGGIRDSIGYISTPPGSTGVGTPVPPAANPVANKPEGGISQLDIENTLRFNNKLTLLTLTAKQLKEVIEHGISEWTETATPGKFPQVGGMAFSFDPSKKAGERVQTLVIYDDKGAIADTIVKAGKVEGDETRKIRIVTLNFLAGGGDGYPFKTYTDADKTTVNPIELYDVLKGKDGNTKTAEPGTEQDALAEYLKATFDNTNPFNIADTEMKDDKRIQNLSKRSDTLIP